MARRSYVSRTAREIERAQRAAQQQREKEAREIERAQRAAQQQREKEAREIERAQRAAQQQREKEAQERYSQARQKQVDTDNEIIEVGLQTLRSILEQAINNPISFTKFLSNCSFLPPRPGTPPVAPDQSDYDARVPKPTILEKLAGIGKDNRLRRTRQIEQEYRQALADYKKEKASFDNKVKEREKAIEEFRQQLAEGNPTAVIQYCAEVLSASKYPEEFPKHIKLAYNGASGELVVEYELPTYEAIMPNIKGFKYIKTRDEVQGLQLTKTDERNLRELYEEVVASVALRTIYELFTAEPNNNLKSVAFNGMVEAIDKATGQQIRPCVVSVHTTREEFLSLDLSRVDKKACLKYLKAQTSPSFAELIPVRPVVDLVTEDSRFIEEVDIISGLDSRSNLLEMDPFEFEHLISNLFSRMGLKTSTTRASRDGGVDVVAFDERPIFGGKVIIQAKRYRNTVEVAAVRDLYGSMLNEGAAKGILVTTSQFGAESRKFAKDKPIELIDGNGLLYLLEQHGYSVKIQKPK